MHELSDLIFIHLKACYPTNEKVYFSRLVNSLSNLNKKLNSEEIKSTIQSNAKFKHKIKENGQMFVWI